MRQAFRHRTVRALVALVALLVMAGPWLGVMAHTVRANEMEPLNITVEVSYKGFNGDPNFSIEAAQGQEVNVTFVWADTAVPDNAHRIHIEGYELKTKIIDLEDREDTLSFVADQTGSFSIECDWRCEGHKEALKSATLEVGGEGGAAVAGPANSYVATNLAFGPSTTIVDSGPVALSTSLEDAAGTPIEGAQVHFYVQKEFAGTEGLMEIGAAETDATGAATYEYVPRFDGEQTVIARFEGMGLYQATEETFPLDVQNAEPAYEIAPPGLEALKNWAPLGVALIVAAVWGTFGYVAYQAYRLARSPRSGGADGP